MARNQINTDVDDDTATELEKIETSFGTKPPTVVRMALKFYLPLFQAAAGKTENIELFAKIGAAVETNPELKPDLEKFLKARIRKTRTAA